MQKKITADDITIQVESESYDRYVINGMALPTGIYDEDLFSTPVIQDRGKINKSGSQNITTDFAKVTGWTADAGNPLTVLSNNELVVGKTAMGRIVFSVNPSFSNSTMRVQIHVNGSAITEFSITSRTTISRVRFLKAGDRISIWAKMTKKKNGWWIFSSPNPTGSIQASGTSVLIEPYADTGIDFEKDMVYAKNAGFYDDAWGRYVSPSYMKQGLPAVMNITGSTNSEGESTVTLQRGTITGPVLAHTRAPVLVAPGFKVRFSGSFRIRRTGNADERSEVTGNKTAMKVRFSLWGCGTEIDEFGDEVVTNKELMHYEAELQPANSSSQSIVDYTIPSAPTLPDATIPLGIDRVYFSCSLVQATDNLYSAGTFKHGNQSQEGQDKTLPKNPSELRYFGWSNANPLKITVVPNGLDRNTKHPLSKTGVAFKNRSIFEGVEGPTECILMGPVDENITIDIYNRTSVRGSLIDSVSVLAGERKVVVVNPSAPAIELASSSTFFVERVKNLDSNTLYNVKTPIKEIQYQNITLDASEIEISREEAAVGSATVTFISDLLDPKNNDSLKIGKRLRILGRHYGSSNLERPSGYVGEAEYDELFTGVIKSISAEYDYHEEEPTIKVVAYDAQDRLNQLDVKVAYDTFEPYGPFLHRSGMTIIENGYDWTGHRAPFPDERLLDPNTRSKTSFIECLIATRNTNKMYLFVDKYDRVIIDRQLKNSNILLSDVLEQGQLYYGQVEVSSDTEDVVNQILLNETIPDTQEYKDRSIGSKFPPEDFGLIKEKQQTAKYNNDGSISKIGVVPIEFSVIRPLVTLRDVYDDKIGEGFGDWAYELLGQLENTEAQVRKLTVPIKNSRDIYWISKLDIMDRVSILHKGNTETHAIRKIKHNITPGKWYTKLDFTFKSPGSYW